MKKMPFFTVLGVGALIASTYATSSLAADASNDVTATIVEALTVDVGMIDFGKFTVGSLGGIIEASGGTTQVNSGDVVIINSGYNADITVMGAQDASYTLTIPAGTTLSDGTNPDLNVEFVNAGSSLRTLDPTGLDTVNLDARLDVPANQGAGVYNGQFTISADY